MRIKYISILLLCLVCIGAQAQIDRSKQPEPGPAPSIQLGKPDAFTLDNGLKVMVVENHKLPRVRASLIIDNTPHGQGDKQGVKALYSSMMGTGTQTMSKEQFNEKIDFLGANIGFGSESAYASSLSKFFPEVMELMADGLLNPKFNEQEFKDQKDRVLESLKLSEKSASAIASNVSSALAYGKDHPYGEFETAETVNSVSLANVQNYYNTYISPANAYLVVVGDVKSNEVKKLAEKHLGNWKKPAPKASNLPEVENIASTEINFINVPNAVQSELRVQNTIDLKISDEDYFPVVVANQILGGSFGSYLNMNLREEHGWTYGARSSTGADKYASRFIASTSVRNAVTDSAVVEILKEINRIKDEKVSQEDLKNAKAKFAGNFVLNLEDPSTIADYALNIETNDLPEDFYETYLKKINAVTAEDIQRVANKYYKTDQLQIVVAGKGSEVLEGLENIQYKGKTIPVKYFDKDANAAEKPGSGKELDPSVTAEKVFADYIEAIGGREAVSNVESMVMKADATVQGMQLNLTSKSTKDGKMLQEVSVGGNVMNKQVFNGDQGVTIAQGQRIPFTEDQVKSTRLEAQPFPELNPGDAKVTGIEEVNGSDAYAVQVSENTTAYYDMKTGLKVQSVKTMSQGGQTMSIPTTYSNYQEVDGVKFPFTISQSMGPQSFEFNVSEIMVNEGVSENDFSIE
ncbi:insulinase family protein [Gramella sp. GC03-9]|uniref:Insulinase family protein n=1 Tax=Christiangramia oceanisediminis TaxID=2920386 RepID=A0A9X2I817_9FLAO|nr:pitrilysin family protein [Gramella oceanisediminis]MCP9198922.1 insulinase family protein [Gramella oceanisediminis]